MTKTFRVLISDEMSSRAQEILGASAAVSCDVRTGLGPEELLSCIGEYDGLLVRSSTKVTSAVFGRATRLKVIGRAGIGVDNIDVKSATSHGVLVENAPTGNVVTTAEHAICLLLSMVRNIPKATASMKQGKWEKKALGGTELCDKVLGVIGLGNIGRIVADRAQGLHMKVVAHDPFLSAEDAGALGIEKMELSDLLEVADFVSVHTPLCDATRGLIGSGEFAMMKPGAFLVNAARGGIVDEAAALDALNSGKLAGAAFDVFEAEPPPASDPLVAHPNVVSTPHLGASTAEAQIKVAVIVAEQMVAFAESGEIRNALNAPAQSGERREKLSSWTRLSEKLGALLGQLASHTGQKVNELRVEAIGNAATEGAKECADHALVGLLTLGALEGSEAKVNEVSARVAAREAGVDLVESQGDGGLSLKSGLRLWVYCGKKTMSVTGTLYSTSGGVEARVIEINEFLVELAPHGTVLVVRNEDKPGVIGSVGSFLGDRGINVHNLHVAHDRHSDAALALWSISSPLDREALGEVEALPWIAQASVLQLGK